MTPPTPPPRPTPRRTWLLVPLAGLGVVLFVVFVASAVIFALFIFPYTQFAQHRLAPPGWSTCRASRLPPESAFLGRWKPAGPAVNIAFADGTPHTMAPDDALTLNADHTYRFLRRGIYNADSQLICLRSETGHWTLSPPNQDYPKLTLVADLPTVVIEHRVIPDLNLPLESYNSMLEEEKHPEAPPPVSQPGDDKRDVDLDNAAGCSSSAPTNSYDVDWQVAVASGQRLAIFHDAPGMQYAAPIAPAKPRFAAQVLYQHVSP